MDVALTLVQIMCKKKRNKSSRYPEIKSKNSSQPVASGLPTSPLSFSALPLRLPTPTVLDLIYMVALISLDRILLRWVPNSILNFFDL